MQCSQVHVEDSEIEADTQRTYKGTARIDLDVLHFQNSEHRDLDVKHIEYLKGCFQRDSCRRLEKNNHIEAVIDQQSLNTALRDSNVSARELLTNQPNGCPKLSFAEGFKLSCIHGQHRIQAAREFLLPGEKWWTVDLYISNFNDGVEQRPYEQTNEESPSDGEAYSKIRQYHFQGDTISETRWKACLRGRRLDNLKTLLADEDLTAGFDALLDIPGIWDGMMITTLQKMMAMGSKDEILNYLGLIKKFFSDLVGGTKHAMLRIGRAEVKALEMRAPGVSAIDAQFLRKQLRGGEIFSSFTDQERDQIWDRLQVFDGLIPSLFTFFKDVQYLQLLVDCLKRLVNVPKRQSVWRTIRRKYIGVNQQEGLVKIQVTNDTFTYESGPKATRVDLGCRQLIAFAMRHYPHMPRDSVSRDAVEKATTKADECMLRRLADLADQLGFDTPQIRTLRQYPLSQITGDNNSHLPPWQVTSGNGIKLTQRSGIPRNQAFRVDQNSLFINHLHDKRLYEGGDITSFFVRKSVYLAFFGRPKEASQSQEKAENNCGNVDDIVSFYNRRETMSELEGAPKDKDRNISRSLHHERLERESFERERQEEQRLDLRRRVEGSERESLQDRSAQALQVQKPSDKVHHSQHERDNREQEKQEEEIRRHKRREQGRREQEKILRGAELATELHTQAEREHLISGSAQGRGVPHFMDEAQESQPRGGPKALVLHSGTDSVAADSKSNDNMIIKTHAQGRRQQASTSTLNRSHLLCITFKVRERGVWRTAHTLEVDSSDPSEVGRIAAKYMRKKMRLYDSNLNMLSPGNCFDAATGDGGNTILLIPEAEIDLKEELGICVSMTVIVISMAVLLFSQA